MDILLAVARDFARANYDKSAIPFLNSRDF